MEYADVNPLLAGALRRKLDDGELSKETASTRAHQDFIYVPRL